MIAKCYDNTRINTKIMTTTLFLARLYGVAFVVLGCSMIMNKTYYKHMYKKMLESEIFIFFGGIMALIAGVAIISYHNIWSNPLAAVISLFGWVGVVKGLLLLLLPERVKTDYQNLLKTDELIFGYGVFVLAIGIILMFVGFFA
jgi:hypothetical protein